MGKAYETKVDELSEKQRAHLAWRLDNKTICGYITAGNIARGTGEWGNMTLLEVFRIFDCSYRSAKIHSKKVVDFK